MIDGALGIKEQADTQDLLPNAEIPTGLSKWTVLVWNVAVLAVGLGFFFQDQWFATYLHALGWPVLIVIWAYLLGRIVAGRKQLRTSSFGLFGR